MKIGFISNYDLDDRSGWSGTISNLNEIISKEYYVVPLVIKENILKKILRHISHGKILYAKALLKLDTKRLQKKINEAHKNGIRLFFAPAQSDLIAYITLPKDAKLIYLSDATFHLMINYYWKLSNHDVKIGNEKEKNTCEKANAIIVASEWAKRDLINYYKIPENKIFVLQFGANLPYIDKVKKNLDSNEIQLLLCGVDWKRKGVDKAIETVNILNNSKTQYKFILNIIGFNKEDITKEYPGYIHFVGKFNKNNINELNIMENYYKTADIFILPTKAECAGIVFSEASMYSLPIITHDTGGVSSYVENNVNGKLLPLSSTANDFADAVLDLLNSGNYFKMSNNSRLKFEKLLNWDMWLNNFNSIVNSLNENIL